MTFASGKWAWGLSDRSGFRYRLRDMKREWTGALVGPDEYDPKHPQLFPPKVGPDPQALRNPRPETDLVDQRNVQWSWDPVGGPPANGINPPNRLVATGQVGAVTVTTTSYNPSDQYGWNPVGGAPGDGIDPPNRLVIQTAVGQVTVVTT
jgi:hypothetical protein